MVENIKNLKKSPLNTSVTCLAWIKRKRHHGKKLFLDLIDSSGEIQSVVEESIPGFQNILSLKPESAVCVKGKLVVFRGNLELEIISIYDIYPNTFHLTDIRTIDIFDPQYTQVINKYRHLYVRNPQFVAIFQLRANVMSYVRQWFIGKGFVEVDAPILTPVPLYHDSTAMSISINKSDVFLTQCAGFYLESLVHALGKIYNMGPSFRAEESRSKRHLMEYWHIKAEMVSGSLETIMEDVESLLFYVVSCLEKNDLSLFQTLGTNLCKDALLIPFPRINYRDAVELLKTKGADIEYGTSLSSKEEEMLSMHFKSPVWVLGIPEQVEPFPYVIDEHSPDQCRVADLICSNGYGELLGTAEKIYDVDSLDFRMKNKGKFGDKRYDWVREVHQTGCVPHVAFGMGLERLMRWLLNIPHVRDCIPFPREYRRKVYP